MISATNATEVRSVVRIEAVVEDFLTGKGKRPARRERELGRFVDFLIEHEDAVKTFDELDWGSSP